MTVLSLRNIGAVNKRSCRLVVLDFVVIQLRILLGKNFGYHIGKRFVCCQALMALHNLYFRIFPNHNEVAWLQQ